MVLKTTKWDILDHLKTEEDRIEFLNAAAEENDPAFLAAAIGVVLKSKGMAQVSKETGLGRETLYKSYSEKGNPTLASMQKTLSTVGYQISFKLLASA